MIQFLLSSHRNAVFRKIILEIGYGKLLEVEEGRRYVKEQRAEIRRKMEEEGFKGSTPPDMDGKEL